MKNAIQQLIICSHVRTHELHKAASELFDRCMARKMVTSADVQAYQAEMQAFNFKLVQEATLRFLLKTEIEGADWEQAESEWMLAL